MTTWAGGDVVTSTWLNTVEQVLALGTFAAATTPRLTLTPNQTYDISGAVASNLRYNGTVTTTGTNQWEGLSFRAVTSSHSGTGFNTLIYMDHEVSALAVGASAYGIIGGVTGNAGSGKINPLYVRCTATGSFAGVVDTIQAAVTWDTGATVGATSAIIGIERSGSNVGSFPMGISFSSNAAGSKLANGIVFLDSLDITSSCYQWNQRAGTSAYFLAEYSSAAVLLFSVDANANIKWLKDGVQLTNDAVNVLQSYVSGDLKIGKASQATGDTTGRVFIPSVAGAPTGVPTDYTAAGYNALVYDRTNNKIYVYDDTANAWKATAALT